MNCAVIELSSGAIVNVIVADPQMDALPSGLLLLAMPPDQSIDQRWMWSESKGFYPGPELQAELDAAAAAEQQAS